MNSFSRAEQKAATRARILEVARAHLEQHGFDATSIRSVAADAGVAAGTVLLHFKDKQALLHASLFDDLERTAASAREGAKHESLEDDLVEIAKTFFDYYAARPSLSRTLLKESLFAAPPWSERFAAQVGGLHVHVAELGGRAIARGEIAEGTDLALLGASFFSFYYFALLAWLQGGHPEPLRMFRRMLAQHLDGVRHPDKKKGP